MAFRFDTGYQETPAGNHALSLHVKGEGTSLVFVFEPAEALALAVSLHKTINAMDHAMKDAAAAERLAREREAGEQGDV